MQIHNRSDYAIAGRELVAEGADLRVQVLTLAAGQCVPWHYHSEISDSFVCLEGPMVVETRAPRRVYRLLPGERCAVPPKRAHYGQRLTSHPECDRSATLRATRALAPSEVRTRLAAGGRRIRTCGPTFKEDSGSEFAIRFPGRRHRLRAF